MVHFSTCRAHGDCQRSDLQYASMHSAWDVQLPSLIDVFFLLWKHPPITAPQEPQEQMGHVFHVTHVGMFGMFFFFATCYNLNQPMVDLDSRFEVIQLDDELANVFIWNSLLGCTPTSPELAITLQCLELYHQLRCCQSSFGIQAYTKVLCVLHG